MPWTCLLLNTVPNLGIQFTVKVTKSGLTKQRKRKRNIQGLIMNELLNGHRPRGPKCQWSVGVSGLVFYVVSQRVKLTTVCQRC